MATYKKEAPMTREKDVTGAPCVLKNYTTVTGGNTTITISVDEFFRYAYLEAQLDFLRAWVRACKAEATAKRTIAVIDCSMLERILDMSDIQGGEQA